MNDGREWLEEYRAVREGVGVADRADLAVLRLWGRDPVKMLQGLITNDLAGAPAGRAVYAAMLTPKGRTVAELRALRHPWAEGAEVLVVLPREALEGTRAHLAKYLPPMFARWADASEEWGVLGVYGPRSGALLRETLSLPVAGAGEDEVRTGGGAGVPLIALGTGYAGGEEGYDLIGRREALPALLETLRAGGAREVGPAALEALRIEAGRPRYGSELDEEVIPTEAFEAIGQMPRAVSFTKGCYTGQEVIVRIAHRGHVNRHLRGLLLGDAPSPAPRTPLFHPQTGREIGWTTSVAFSPLLGETVALGYVRREVEPGGHVRLGAADGPEVVVAALPFRPADAA